MQGRNTFLEDTIEHMYQILTTIEEFEETEHDFSQLRESAESFQEELKDLVD